MQLTIIGGDARNRHLAALATARGHQARWIGNEETARVVSPCGRVVMPFPVAEAEGLAPVSPGAGIPMNAVLPLLKPGALVYATKPGPILAQYMQEHGCIPIDFTQSEAFTLRNAIPSAEGSIHAVMSRAGVCLSGSKCLVVGYGRLGRALALRLMGLRAQVYVAARSPQARAQAEGDGCRALTMEELATPRGCRFVFNTVPVPVLGEAAFAALAPGALAVDVSSPPYGFALDTAQAMGVGAWREPGLPGRYAPETAAEAMLSVIEEKDGA